MWAIRQSIVILIPYFGKWPPWIDFFIESCRSNSRIDWILFSDTEPPENRARNVRHILTSFEEYRDQLSQTLGIRVGAETPYKLCDVRPALAHAHAKLVSGYDFVGFGDIDVIYGDIRAFYDDDALETYDLLSSHANRVSGHFCLMRNNEEMSTAYQRVHGWKKVFASADYHNFDERAFYNLFRNKRLTLLPRRRALSVRPLYREAYSTPALAERMRWYWEDGQLTNEFYPHHPFMYLHFMSWHSNRWYRDLPEVRPGTPAPWSLLTELVQMDWRDARKEGFMISSRGIEPIDRRSEP